MELGGTHVTREPFFIRCGVCDVIVEFTKNLERFGVVHRACRLERTVRVARDHAAALCEAHVGREPIIFMHIGETIILVTCTHADLRITRHRDLQKFCTIECAIRSERPVRVAFHGVDGGKQTDARGLRRDKRRIGVEEAEVFKLQRSDLQRKQYADEEEKFLHRNGILSYFRCFLPRTP